MYITKTTDNVRKLVGELENRNDIHKIKFIIYIFNLLNNNQINDKNEVNPDLSEDENIKILNFSSLGLFPNTGTICLQHLVGVYNTMIKTNKAYEDNGSALGIMYDEDDNKLISQFEKLSFNEKLDVVSEIIIRYDNETYFNRIILMKNLANNISGFDIASLIYNFKICNI